MFQFLGQCTVCACMLLTKDNIVEDQDEDASLVNLPILHLFHHVSISRLYV
jgi:hypothetical protein